MSQGVLTCKGSLYFDSCFVSKGRSAPVQQQYKIYKRNIAQTTCHCEPTLVVSPPLASAKRLLKGIKFRRKCIVPVSHATVLEIVAAKE